MSTSDIAPTVSFTFNDIDFAGQLSLDAGAGFLAIDTDEGPEYLSTDLTIYGLLPEPGCVFVKDWSEHSGLAEALQDAGLVRITRTIDVRPHGPGSYALRAHEVLVL